MRSLGVVPEDFNHIVLADLLAVDRAHTLPTVEALLDAVVAGHVATRQDDVVLVAVASQTHHFVFPLFKFQGHVVAVVSRAGRHLLQGLRLHFKTLLAFLDFSLQVRVLCLGLAQDCVGLFISGLHFNILCLALGQGLSVLLVFLGQRLYLRLEVLS